MDHTGAKSAYIAGYLRTLRTYRAAGGFLISAVITPEAHHLRCNQRQVRLLQRRHDDGAAFDDEQAAYYATLHLLKLGRRRIDALTADPASVFVAQPRKRGYLRAMTESKGSHGTATGTFFYESDAPGVDELLQQGPGLTAIFVISDEMGPAIVNELQRRGLRAPEDGSVLGFDNTSTSRPVNPPMRTMEQPLARGWDKWRSRSCSAPMTWGRRSCRTGW
ncbi:substrate-binding domain-containing protein [Pseudarthrobacter oxydans]